MNVLNTNEAPGYFDSTDITNRIVFKAKQPRQQLQGGEKGVLPSAFSMYFPEKGCHLGTNRSDNET